MATARLRNSAELFQDLYNLYVENLAFTQQPNQNYKIEHELEDKILALQNQVAALSHDEFVNFCLLKPENSTYNINGLWLALWHPTSKYKVQKAIIEKLVDLPQSDFAKLDFTSAANFSSVARIGYVDYLNYGVDVDKSEKNINEISTLQKIAESYIAESYDFHKIAEPHKVMNKVLSLPSWQLEMLRLDSICQFSTEQPSNLSRPLTTLWIGRIEGGTLVSIAKNAFYPRLGDQSWRFWSDFVLLLKLVPAYTNDWFDCFLDNSIKYCSTHYYDDVDCSTTKELLILMKHINALKCAAMDTSEPKKKVARILSAVLLTNMSNTILYFLAQFLDHLIPTCATNKDKISLLEKIALHKHEIDLYRQSRLELANIYFTEKQKTLAEKLTDLEKAFTHAFTLWLHDHNETRLLFRIAEAYLYASEKNLNSTQRCQYELPALVWLDEELTKITNEPPDLYNQEEIKKVAAALFTLLKTQRNLVAPFYEEVQNIKNENAKLQAEMAKMKEQMSKLMLAVEQYKKEIPAAEPETSSTSSRLFYKKLS